MGINYYRSLSITIDEKCDYHYHYHYRSKSHYRSSLGYGSKQTMEEENRVKEKACSLEAQKSDGEEEPKIGSKRASN